MIFHWWVQDHLHPAPIHINRRRCSGFFFDNSFCAEYTKNARIWASNQKCIPYLYLNSNLTNRTAKVEYPIISSQLHILGQSPCSRPPALQPVHRSNGECRVPTQQANLHSLYTYPVAIFDTEFPILPHFPLSQQWNIHFVAFIGRRHCLSAIVAAWWSKAHTALHLLFLGSITCLFVFQFFIWL